MKIFVMGQSGSGKSTLAKKLHDILNLPLIELDPIWVRLEAHRYPKNHPERTKGGALLVAEVERLMQQHWSWIIDGNFHNTRPKIIRQADIVIFLDTPLHQRIWNNLKRHLSGQKRIHRFWHHLGSIIKYSRIRHRMMLTDLAAAQGRMVRLTSWREAEAFLDFVRTKPKDMLAFPTA